MHPRDLRRRIFTGIFLLVLIWIGLGVWSAIKGVRAALDARDGIDLLLEEYEPEDIARGEADAALADVRDDFRTAASELGGWELGPARFLPVVGRQLRSGAELSEAGAELLDIGLVLTSELSVLADELEGGGELPAALRQLARPLAELRDRAERIDFGPEESLVGVLASARREAVQRHFELLDTLTRAADGATGFAAFLEGPSTYLLFAANTSQMQSGTGGLLSMGEVTVVDGEISVGRVSTVADLALPDPGRRVELEADYAARWGWLDPNDNWSSLGLTPRFDVTASTAAAMWEAIGGEPVDGVLAVDPVAISALLHATGPVRIDGDVFGPDELLTYLAHDQYLDLTPDIYGDGSTFNAVQAERRDHLASIASQVVVGITGDDVDEIDVLIRLAEAARGRHLMFWSNEAVQQQAWRAAGISGELSSDSMLLSLVNRSATKGDFYMSMNADMSFERNGDVTEVVVEVEVVNRIPFGEPRYVAGPHPSLDINYGDHLAIVALNMPGWARNGRVDGDENLAVAGGDGPTRVVGSWITTPRGGSETRTFRFELPEEIELITVEPGARHPVSNWRVGSERWTDDAPHEIRF